MRKWAVRHEREQATSVGALATTRSDRGTRDPVIEFESVTLAYGRGESAVRALDKTSIKIGEGDFVALVGPSGCGKSTILKLVGGLISATTGYVFVAGREVGAEDVRIGMAFQSCCRGSRSARMSCCRSRSCSHFVPAGAVNERPNTAIARRLCWPKSGCPDLATSIRGSFQGACNSGRRCAAP